MTRILITILLFITFSVNTFGQGKALINIFEENTYPNISYAYIAKERYTWTINGTVIKYKTGVYPIKVNKGDVFDTIRSQKIGITVDVNGDNRRTIYDTSNIVILCKLRNGHNYKLGQTFTNLFELYSLDTLETAKTIIFKMINKKNADTLYLNRGAHDYKIYKDTTISISEPNDNMKESFMEHIQLNRAKKEYAIDGTPISNGTVFELYYQYLHAEKVEVDYDFSKKKYKLKLLK